MSETTNQNFSRKTAVISSARTSPYPSNYSGFKNTSRTLVWENKPQNHNRFKISLYRFLRDNIPLLNSCIWTWSRLASAPGQYRLESTASDSEQAQAAEILDRLGDKIYPFKSSRLPGIDTFLPFLFSSLFTDGAFAGILILNADYSGIDRLVPVDPSDIDFVSDNRGSQNAVIDTPNGPLTTGPDFYYMGLNADSSGNAGKSILASVPFVSRIQQQLLDDMQKTMHNSGYHRLHVKITPPERQAGESDDAYVTRINEYFDETVSMIRGCEPEDNPVTWDNVAVEYIGPGQTRAVTNSWFMSHRAMIEEICAGTNLSAFMLGYSYGTTHNWAQFKYDLVMRQVATVQRQAARFLEWMGNIELALHGIDRRCQFTFDNNFTYLSTERASIEKTRTDNLIALYQAGLLSKEEAAKRAGKICK